MIPYGADPVIKADENLVKAMGLTPNGYFISIARIEKENSILEMVKAFSMQDHGMKFVVLGKFEPDNAYHNEIKRVASNNVIFPGAIYNQKLVQALRFHARAYCHGHTVGGTNPSLVESMQAGNIILAHDNKFNRFTAGEGQFYFRDSQDCLEHFQHLSLVDSTKAREASRARAKAEYGWDKILNSYKEALLDYA